MTGAWSEVVVEKIVHGGEGLARDAEGILFVPGSAPGERVRVRVRRERGARRVGEIETVLESSPGRRDPPCPHVGACGGCQLQHLVYQEQVLVKSDIVREQLRRLGGIAWDGPIPVLSGPEFGYRLRAQWKVRPADPSGAPLAVGYHRARSHQVVDVDACPLLAPPLAAALADVRAALRADAGATDHAPSDVAAALGQDGVIALSPALAGHAEGEVAWRVGGVLHRFHPRAFFQVNRHLLEPMTDLVTGSRSGGRALDLFCGAGFFSLPLGRRFTEVTGVERDARSVAAARRAAEENGVEGCRFEQDDAERWLRTSLRRGKVGRPDLVVADPPRAGLGRELVRGIAATGTPCVVYVSCDAATLARDLRVFAGAGYAPVSVTAVDLFPQTFHVETVVDLRPSANPL